MTTWPETLPQHVLVQGFSRKPTTNVVAFGTEVGPGKTRRRSTARTVPMTMPIKVNAAQLAIFETFFRNDLADGSMPFDWVDPVDGTAARFKFDPASTYSVTSRTGALFLITMSLIKQP